MILLMEDILHQLIGSLYHCLQGLYVPGGAGFVPSTVSIMHHFEPAGLPPVPPRQRKPIRKLQILQDSFAMPFPKREAPRRPSLDSWSENGGMLSCSIFIASRWMTSCQSVGELWNRPPFSEDGHLSAFFCFEEIWQGMFLFPWQCSKLVPNWNSSSRCVTKRSFGFSCWWPQVSGKPPQSFKPIRYLHF